MYYIFLSDVLQLGLSFTPVFTEVDIPSSSSSSSSSVDPLSLSSTHSPVSYEANGDRCDNVTPTNITMRSESMDDPQHQAIAPGYAYYDIDDSVDIAMFLSHRIHKLRSKLDIIMKNELLHPQYNVAISDYHHHHDDDGDNNVDVDAKSKAYIEVCIYINTQ
jgi:hypothetical protein